MKTYNKLVRDRIPTLLEQEGKKFEVETLNHDRYIMELKKKLSEELMEYQEASSNEEAIEELADLLELIHSLAPIHKSTFEEIEQMRIKRAEELGRFDEKQFLLEAE